MGLLTYKVFDHLKRWCRFGCFFIIFSKEVAMVVVADLPLVLIRDFAVGYRDSPILLVVVRQLDMGDQDVIPLVSLFAVVEIDKQKACVFVDTMVSMAAPAFEDASIENSTSI